MPLPKFVVRAATRGRPLVPASAWPTLLAARTLAGDGPVLSGPPRGRLLSLSAHPDDDTIGCGGTLALATQAGSAVTAAMATSGGASIGSRLTAQELAAARESDARRACARLGVHDVRFLGFEDGNLAASHDELVAALEAILVEVSPDAVFVPWAWDGHRDHQALHRAVLDLPGRGELELWSYETWTPLPPNRHVDVTSTHDRKQQALDEHATAAEAFDLHALASLSRYRSAHTLMGRGHAEAFLVSTLDDMRHLVARIDT